MMKGTRFKPLFSDFFSRLKREFRIGMTPVPVGKKWVFLVGCYNSGTTLLAELMGQHPQVSALPTEGHFITDQFVKDYELGVPRMWVDREDIFRLDESDKGPDATRLKKEWAMRLDPSKPVFVEKSPPNSAKTRWLQANFENSYFVGIIRNGYAVAEGISRKAEPRHRVEPWPIEKSAYQWKRSNEILAEDAQHLENFLWVTYEDLALDPQKTLGQITQFIGIENFPEVSADQDWAIHERKEPIRDMNNDSIAKLSQEQILMINRVAGSALERFGYARL